MAIRAAQPTDDDEIRGLVADAFGEEGALVSEVVSAMLTHDRCRLWVVGDTSIDGVVGVSEASIESEPDTRVWVLAPIAVKPGVQGSGIGTALVRHCLHHLESDGAAGVFVYGDPSYYGRFGFDSAATGSIRAPFTLEYPEGWQALWWQHSVTTERTRLNVEGPFGKPEYW